MALTPKQERFCEEYLVDLNGSAAYQRAGYKARGNVAETNAARLLRNAQVQARVQELQAARSERTEVDADWVVKRLRREALFEGKGSAHAARIRAIELLGKHLGMFTDNVNITGIDELIARELSRLAAAGQTSDAGPSPAAADAWPGG